MAKDVLITPASGLVQFKDAGGNVDATIQLDDANILNITGNIALGDLAANVYVGDGVNSVDIIFEQNGAIRALAGKTLTLGQSNSNISFAANITSGANIAGNVIISANISATGNVIGGNVTTTGLVNAGTLSVTGTSNLGAVGNVTITGGSSGQYLQTNGSGVLSWQSISTSSISNGNSNVNIPVANGNVNISAAGNANVLVVTGTGANINGTLSVSGNSNVGNLGATGVFATTLSSTGNSNVGNLGTGGLITATGNITGGNFSTTGLTSAGTLSVSGTSDLGAVGNVRITGGTNGYVLSTDGTGNLAWSSITTSIVVDEFTGDGSNTSYTLSVSPASENYTIVGVAGTLQPKISYSVSGNVLTFSSAPPSGSPIEVTTFTSTAISAPPSSNNAGLTWNIVGANAQMLAFNGYFVDSSAGAISVTLPISGTLGDTIKINDLAGAAGANNITVLRNGHNIQGAASDLLIDYDNATVELVYSNSTYGWKAIGL